MSVRGHEKGLLTTNLAWLAAGACFVSAPQSTRPACLANRALFCTFLPTGAPPSPKQGERVHVERMGGPAAACGPGGIPVVRRLLADRPLDGGRAVHVQRLALHADLVGRLHQQLTIFSFPCPAPALRPRTRTPIPPSRPALPLCLPPPQVDVRPGFETAPVSAAEVAEMKAREHAIVVSVPLHVDLASAGRLLHAKATWLAEAAKQLPHQVHHCRLHSNCNFHASLAPQAGERERLAEAKLLLPLLLAPLV